MFKYLIIVSSLIVFQACATSYQEKSFTGGFSHTQLDENIFKITFEGNSSTSQERADDFVLLRGAELTLEHNFKYFAVINRYNHNEYEAYTSGYSNNSYNGAYTGTSSNPIKSKTIICFNEKPKDKIAFNAKFLKMSLNKKYDLGLKTRSRLVTIEDYKKKYCPINLKGELDHVVDGSVTIDCLSDTHAYQFDFAKKWAEAIDLSNRISKVVGRKPGVVLIAKTQSEMSFVRRLDKAFAKNNSDISVNIIKAY